MRNNKNKISYEHTVGEKMLKFVYANALSMEVSVGEMHRTIQLDTEGCELDDTW